MCIFECALPLNDLLIIMLEKLFWWLRHIIIVNFFLQAGSINCENEPTFCKELGIYPRKAPRVFVYSYKAIESGSLVEYKGDWATKNLKGFCQEHLPRFSKRVDLDTFDFSSGTVERLPRVMLLSTKKDTPVIWRALSGLYRKRFIFYDVEVSHSSLQTCNLNFLSNY